MLTNHTDNATSPPLKGLKVLEFSGLGPAPLAGQLLADLGADVITVDRASQNEADPTDIHRRNKRSIALNLKSAEGVAVVQRLLADTDILLEGFRPGVMERLGLGPKDCPSHIIYGRVTGWGQDGPLAQSAGHDINYLALTGALHAIGPSDAPVPPLNLVGDYAGGTMFLLFGVFAALFERQKSGQGQVVDAAMVDAVPAMMGLLQGMLAKQQWVDARQRNLLDGGAPFYHCYATADDQFISVGALEPQFFAELCRLAGLPEETEDYSRHDPSSWASMREHYASVFRCKTRDEWSAIFAGSDACVAPVLSMTEAAQHPHNQYRGVFLAEEVLQAAPAPRFSRSVTEPPRAPQAVGRDGELILQSLGFSAAEINALRESGVLR